MGTKKYLTRAIKYFIFLMVIVTLVIVLMVLFGFVEANINSMFRNGYNAVWEIALIFFAVALVYPKIGFGTRSHRMRGGSWDDVRDDIFRAMTERSYKLENDFGTVMTFRKRGIAAQLGKFLEDRITISKAETESDGGGATGVGTDSTEMKAGTEGTDMMAGQGAQAGQDGAMQGITAQEGIPAVDRLKKYEVQIEGLTKDVLRVVSALYGIQNRNRDE